MIEPSELLLERDLMDVWSCQGMAAFLKPYPREGVCTVHNHRLPTKKHVSCSPLPWKDKVISQPNEFSAHTNKALLLSVTTIFDWKVGFDDFELADESKACNYPVTPSMLLSGAQCL